MHSQEETNHKLPDRPESHFGAVGLGSPLSYPALTCALHVASACEVKVVKFLCELCKPDAPGVGEGHF